MNVSFGSSTANLRVDDAYTAINRVVYEDECEQCQNAPSSKGPCNLAGGCLCTVSGKLLKRLRESFSTLCAKAFAKPHTEGRKELKGGCWLFRIAGRRVAAAVAPPDGDAPAEEEIIYLHVAKQSLIPWIPTWHRVTATESDCAALPITDTRIYTQVAIAEKVSLVMGYKILH